MKKIYFSDKHWKTDDPFGGDGVAVPQRSDWSLEALFRVKGGKLKCLVSTHQNYTLYICFGSHGWEEISSACAEIEIMGWKFN